MPMTDDWDQDSLMYMNAPLVSLAVLLGESKTALDHCAATGQVIGIVILSDVVTTAAAAWAIRRRESGALTPEEALDLDAVVADARTYLTEHPGELAEHDQMFAHYEALMRGAG